MTGTRPWGDTWECRYFASELPPRLSPRGLRAVLPRLGSTALEEDVYLIGRTRTVNAKIRQRTATRREASLKVKCQVEEEGDGFRLWRTEIDSELPAGPSVWRLLLSRLGAGADPEALARCRTSQEALRTLEGAVPQVRIRKKRRFYGSPEARVESAEVWLPAGALYSVEIESRDVDRARTVRDLVGASDLGEPTDYAELCAKFTPDIEKST